MVSHDEREHGELPRTVGRVGIRLVAVASVGVLLVSAGTFTGGIGSIVLGVIGMLSLLVGVLSDRLSSDRLSSVRLRLVQLLATGVCGALLNHTTGYAGWVLLGLSIVGLVGTAAIGPRVAAGSVAGIALLSLAGGPGDGDTVWSWLPVNLAVLGALALGGYSRRVAALRRQSELALVERSRQLVAETERARAETARAAALEERARIAGDLHDVLAHALGGLVVQLDAAEGQLVAGTDRDEVAARLRSSRQLAVSGLRDARAAVRELRVGAGEGERVDPADAVDDVVRGPLGEQLGMGLEVVGDRILVPDPVATAFAAVARESITNIAKHAPGARVSATLVLGSGTARLEILNGRSGPDGTDPDLAGSGSGVGISAMARRMRDVGGAFTAGPVGPGRWMSTATWKDDER